MRTKNFSPLPSRGGSCRVLARPSSWPSGSASPSSPSKPAAPDPGWPSPHSGCPSPESRPGGHEGRPVLLVAVDPHRRLQLNTAQHRESEGGWRRNGPSASAPPSSPPLPSIRPEVYDTCDGGGRKGRWAPDRARRGERSRSASPHPTRSLRPNREDPWSTLTDPLGRRGRAAGSLAFEAESFLCVGSFGRSGQRTEARRREDRDIGHEGMSGGLR